MSEHTAPNPDPTSETLAPGSDPTTEFAAQDWLLVIEALATCAGPPPTAGYSPPRANGALTRSRTRRAWELIDAIIAAIDLPPGKVASRIDDDWRGHDLGLGCGAPVGE